MTQLDIIKILTKHLIEVLPPGYITNHYSGIISNITIHYADIELNIYVDLYDDNLIHLWCDNPRRNAHLDLNHPNSLEQLTTIIIKYCGKQ